VRIAAIFGLNQIVSHGFGVFLFAALVPLMRESIAMTSWHLAAIGATSQLSYLGGALLLSLFGHRFNTTHLMLGTGILSTSLIFVMSQLRDPLIITAVLAILGASAAISWGTIVEIISRNAASQQCSTYLSCAASGTAWGYGINGLLILLVVPLLGWQGSWQVAALIGCVVLCLTWRLLANINNQDSIPEAPNATMIPASRLLITIVNERTALFTCLICFLVGFSTMPFANWLNTFLDELGAPASTGGYTWTIVGLSGMAAGFMAGRVADRIGAPIALLMIFACFLICLLVFVYDPSRFAFIAGIGYGLMYFPVWGILAGWLRQHYSSTATMQISSIGMVTSGLGGAFGNVLAGYIRNVTGSLTLVYIIVTASVLLLVLLSMHILRLNHSDSGVASNIDTYTR